jgi:hypothetical protein
MLYRTLIISIFILLAWFGIQQSKFKVASAKTNQQLLLVQQQLLVSQQKSLQQQNILKQQIELLLKEQKKPDEKLTSKPEKKIKAKKKKKKPIVKQKTGAEIIASLNKSLADINKYQKNKKLDKASTLLKQFKQELWKVRKNKEINKKTVLSIMSPIDITLKKWKEKKGSYTTKIIHNKMKYLSVKRASK